MKIKSVNTVYFKVSYFVLLKLVKYPPAPLLFYILRSGLGLDLRLWSVLGLGQGLQLRIGLGLELYLGLGYSSRYQCNGGVQVEIFPNLLWISPALQRQCLKFYIGTADWWTLEWKNCKEHSTCISKANCKIISFTYLGGNLHSVTWPIHKKKCYLVYFCRTIFHHKTIVIWYLLIADTYLVTYCNCACITLQI